MAILKNPTLKAKRAPFNKLLDAIPGLGEELTDATNDLVHACTETGKTGEVLLRIKVKPLTGKSGQIELDTEVKAKLPTPTRGKTLMFATPDNNLQRENPRQQTLDGLKTADQEAESQSAELRSAPSADAAKEETKLRAVH